MRGWMLMAGVISLVFSERCLAQVSDDFSDGDFTANPCWTGDAGAFEVNSSKQLHLKSSGTDTSFLSTPNSLIDSTEWRFWIKLSFSPSSNNFARAYLVSDQADLGKPLNGYFLQFGEAGSNDAIELFRQTGTDTLPVCRGPAGMIAASFTIHVKVTRSQGGFFTLFADTLTGNDYFPIASGFDNTWNSTVCFGFSCRYTTTDATKFYFDDVIIRNIYQDTIPPELLSVSVPNPHQLDLLFSEKPDPLYSLDSSNYLADPGLGHPDTVKQDLSNPEIIHLIFHQAFENGQIYSLSVSNIRDPDGNVMPSAQVQFDWYIVRQFDVLINEIMADPEPQVGLPPFEYVELYNRTSLPIDLGGWIFLAGSVTKVIPAAVIQPHGFMILASEQARLFLSKYGPFAGFSSFSLANDGAGLVLENAAGQLISSVSYLPEWYKNPLKENGGWSLEQIDPSNPCGGIDNWTASCASAGGTPCKQNSVFGINPDHSAPELMRIHVTDNTSIRLFFSEALDSSRLMNNAAYTFDNGLGAPLSIRLVPPGYQDVDITLNKELETGIIYHLSFNDSITDCAGNLLDVMNGGRFALPDIPAAGDVIINEILYNPKSGGSEFVELFNRSLKVVDLKDLVLSTVDTLTHVLKDPKEISTEGFLMFPGDYLVLTSSPDNIKLQYSICSLKNFVTMASWPELTNTGGMVAIADKSLRIIDQASYSDAMQFPLLTSTQGVSLERLSPERPSADRSNWHSASAAAGFATPACKNSQSTDFMITDENFHIEPEIFSPDNDGYQDLLNIQYRFDVPGNVATLRIFTDRGRLVKILMNNEVLGTSGMCSWDGFDENRKKAPVGMYIVMAEFFDLSGHVSRKKKVVVLAGRG